MSYFYLDAKEFDKVAQTIEKFSDRSVAEQIINDYLANEGGKKIKEYIRAILPVSAEHGTERKQQPHRPIRSGYRERILQ